MENIAEYLKAERSQDWRVEIRKGIKTKERVGMIRANMPEEDPNIRNQSVIEVNKGLTFDQAVAEAQRCIDCPDPTCMTGCPVGINIPKFIKRILVSNL